MCSRDLTSTSLFLVAIVDTNVSGFREQDSDCTCGSPAAEVDGGVW